MKIEPHIIFVYVFMYLHASFMNDDDKFVTFRVLTNFKTE